MGLIQQKCRQSPLVILHLHHLVKSIDLMNVSWNFPDVLQISSSISVVLEVDERKKFLDHMLVLGKGKEYQLVISNEIADVSSV